MDKCKITYLSSVKFLIISEIIESMKKNNLIFVNKEIGVKINDIKYEIIHHNTTEFGIYDTKKKEKIGSLDFSNSSYSRKNENKKIIWKIKLSNISHEKTAMRIVNAIQKTSKNIRVVICT